MQKTSQSLSVVMISCYRSYEQSVNFLFRNNSCLMSTVGMALAFGHAIPVLSVWFGLKHSCQSVPGGALRNKPAIGGRCTPGGEPGMAQQKQPLQTFSFSSM